MGIFKRKSTEDLKRELDQEEKLKKARDDRAKALQNKRDLARRVQKLKTERKYGTLIKVGQAVKKTAEDFSKKPAPAKAPMKRRRVVRRRIVRNSAPIKKVVRRRKVARARPSVRRIVKRKSKPVKKKSNYQDTLDFAMGY